MNPAPQDVMAAAARAAAEGHQEWDSLAQFGTLHWDGGNLTPGLLGIIDRRAGDRHYLRILPALAAQWIMEYPGRPPYAYVLQYEGFGVRPPAAGASMQEKTQFARDHAERRFHLRDDARELLIVNLADMHGRLWRAEKVRGDEQEIRVHFCGPGSPIRRDMFAAALLGIADGTAALLGNAN